MKNFKHASESTSPSIKNESLKVQKHTSQPTINLKAKELEIYRLKNELDSLRSEMKTLLETNKEAEISINKKSNFISFIAHEIRNPLNAILNLSGLLLEDNPRKDQLKNLYTLKFSCDNLQGIVNDTLDLEKIEGELLELENIEFDILELLHQMENSYDIIAERKNIEFNIEIPENCPKYLLGDPLRLGQILNNLINNAIKFTKKGEVKLEVRFAENKNGKWDFSFIIKDTGIGIGLEKQKSIFQPFVQAQSNTSRNFGGSGLGLSISKKLAELMGGEIHLVSEKNIGSQFSLNLSFDRALKLESNPILDSENENQLSGMRILLAEDNMVNIMIAKQIFEAWGNDLDIVTDGRQVLEQLELKNYDLILMDLNMPVMDGLMASRKIRARDWQHKNIPIIALTASNFIEEKTKALAAGMNDFICKPFRPQSIFQKLSSYA